MNSYEFGIHQLVKMNEEYGDTWILPEYKDCLRFVLTEIGEVADALMRMNPKFFRNRDFTQGLDDFYTEACDVVMMCMKALMSIKYEYNYSFYGLDAENSIEYAVLQINSIVTDDLLSGDTRAFPLSIETRMISLLLTIEKIAGETYFNNYIVAKMNKTREKIIARKAAANVT